jgi:hypothetical protein
MEIMTAEMQAQPVHAALVHQPRSSSMAASKQPAGSTSKQKHP